ncbi:hypothetical protein L6164_002195 [Bauhinia variegata]|uniref:Uncharacterized protein n=1 Tax=Bauhinia variegata TaxID=167791 RepID=A0ACB9PYY5_BAUVA|nr:hypothetical protein L6164_002195 [Bauhinia variegata]
MLKPNRKTKKPNASSKLVLEEIIGLTTKNGNGLASNVSTSNCAYLAGCVVVVYNVNSGTQSRVMVSHRLPKPLTCVVVSQDGRFIAAGEAGGSQSSVLVWDSATLALISELKGHLYGVVCISFSPDGKHLVSVGEYIYLWDWRNNELVTKVRASSSCSAVSSVSFSSDGKFIVTFGKKHLKFWELGQLRRTQLNGDMGRTGSLTIHRKAVNLAIHKGTSFISITSSVWSNSSFSNCKHAGDLPMYGLTDAGILCLIHTGMLSITKSVDLKVKKGFALSASRKHVACACNNGIVKIFSLESLEYMGSVVYSNGKKCYGESNTICHTQVPEQDIQHLLTLPDAVACQFSTLEKLVVVYGDHSLYIWDIHDVNQATRCCVLVSHSACIWDIKNLCCENNHDPSLACIARGCSGGVSFATCSIDGTIRLWDLALQANLSEYDAEHHSLRTELMGSSCLVSAGTFERDAVETDISSQEFRSLAVSSDGKYLAAGDCKGNLHIYNLQTSDYTCFQGAHDADILTLSFSLPPNDRTSKNSYYLASGGLDCIIHLDFDLIDSFHDHSAAVTSVRTTSNSSTILSCSADSFLVLRDVEIAGSSHKILQHHRQKASHGTVYDMAVDPTFEVVVTVGQDKKINTFDLAARKLIRSYKQDKDFGDPIKVAVDPGCTYVVCSYSNKSICIYDFIKGEMVAKAMGHAEVVTGVIFLPDCKHIVSVDGDGCIFVWKLPPSLSSRILERIMDRSNPLSPRSLSQSVGYNHLIVCEEECEQSKINLEHVWSLNDNSQTGERILYPGKSPKEASAFKFSVSRLPKWAQAKVTSSNIDCRGLKYHSSEACANSSPEVQTPSDHLSASLETGMSKCSPRPQGTFSNFALDKRWFSVYTVCMDALSSPEMRSLMDTTTSESSSCLIKDNNEMSTDQCSSGGSSHSKHDKLGHVFDQHSSCNSNNVSRSECVGELSNTEVVAEQLHLDDSGSETQANTEANFQNMQFEDSDIFNQHFGSLSKTNKMGRRKSSMRRYSSRYVLQQDYPGDCKRLFSTPVRNMTDKTMNFEEDSIHIVSEDTSLQDVKNIEQSLEDSICESTRSPVKENSADIELGKVRNQDESVSQTSEQEKTIPACKEVLCSLNAAAESAFRLFSKLELEGSGEETYGAHELNEAAELLPSITEKVLAVARMLQCRKNSSFGNRVGNPGSGTDGKSTQ